MTKQEAETHTEVTERWEEVLPDCSVWTREDTREALVEWMPRGRSLLESVRRMSGARDRSIPTYGPTIRRTVTTTTTVTRTHDEPNPLHGTDQEDQ